MLSRSARVIVAAVACTLAIAVQPNEEYTTNAICRQNNCINPVFPGMSDLSVLESSSWQCQPMASAQSYLRFCKSAVDYDVAVPSPNTSMPLAEMVAAQEKAAITMYVYHLAGLNIEALENRQPENSVDFMYMPQGPTGSGNAGHAFLNFRDLTYVAQFAAISHGEGVGTLANADLAALDNKLEEIRKSSTDDDWQPKLIDFEGYARAIPNGRELNADAPPFLSVTHEVASNRAALRTQIEFYFSQANLAKDKYLRSQMNDEGWVPVKLIASFPKVRAYVPSVKDIVMIMSESDSVEVNEKKYTLRSSSEELRKQFGSKGTTEE